MKRLLFGGTGGAAGQGGPELSVECLVHRGQGGSGDHEVRGDPAGAAITTHLYASSFASGLGNTKEVGVQL